jgi:signal transduction histidine kinase
MVHLIRLSFIVGLLCLCLGQASAVTLSGQASEVSLNNAITFWKDPTGKATIDDARSPAIAPHFLTPNKHEPVLNLGFSQSPYWIRFTINRDKTAHSKWVLEIPYLGISHINLYQPDGAVQKSGSLVSVPDRPLFGRFYGFPLEIGTEPTTFYLQVRSDYPTSLPIRLIDQHRFNEIQAKENLLQFAYFGGLLSLLIYNMSLFLFVRDTKYLSYSLFTFFTGLGIFAGNGYGSVYFWPEAPHWDAIAQPCLLSFGGAYAILFTTAFLRTRKYLPKTHVILMILGGLYLAIAITLLGSLWLSIPHTPLFQILFALSLISPVISIGAAIRNIRYNIRSARFFLLAWGILCLGVLVASARMFNLIPSNPFTLYALQISSGFEMLLFSLALAYRIQWERQQREEAQSALIASQQETVRTLQLSEERLENAVDARTQNLQRLLLSEQHMRSQYTRFCALIAHEFRNPLNIIQAQATVLDRDPAPSPEKNQQRSSVIRSAITRLVRLFDQWLANDRVNMAMDQLNCSSIDVGPWLQEVCNGCRGYYIDHTLRLATVAEVVYVHADPHLLEIAILNLISNACKYSPKGSVIDVSTQMNQNAGEIGICIQDHGSGIAVDQLRIILEPYVRAAHDEAAPDGLGLGLAFVQRIMELHDGRVEIASAIGQGTTVTLWLRRD